MSSTLPRDPYEVLGVARDADETAIKKSFRKLARELHPDVNAHDPDAEEKFKEAAEAYEILSDPQRREIFDRYGHEGLRSGGMRPNFEGFGSIGDLFEAFFGPAFGGGFAATHGGPVQGEDAIVGAELTLAQAASGASVEIAFEAVDRCDDCSGNGAVPGTPISTCERCAGAGVVQLVSRSPFGQVVRTTACDACAGEGKIPESPCPHCEGRGRVVRPRTLRVDVPAGIADGQRIRLAGRGHAGERGGPPGDLYVQARVADDEHLLRDGDDLVTVLDVPAPLAALGATLDAPALDGTAQVKVPAGTQPGEILVLRGEGMPQLRRPERRGDLRVVVNVVIPRRLSDDQKALVRELADSLGPENLAAPEGMGSKLRRLFGAR
jgi:molecular chaperone DnaJ